MKQFVKVNAAEYSTDFDFFLRNQILVIHHQDKTTSFCSLIEKRCFIRDEVNPLDEDRIFNVIMDIHRDILRAKYGAELDFQPQITSDVVK
nr:hypothetical protein [uncultured Draconibacterium sp.]